MQYKFPVLEATEKRKVRNVKAPIGPLHNTNDIYFYLNSTKKLKAKIAAMLALLTIYLQHFVIALSLIVIFPLFPNEGLEKNQIKRSIQHFGICIAKSRNRIF